MKKNDGFTLIELLVTLVIVGVIMTFIISMMSSQYAIIRDVDAYLVMSSENKDLSRNIMNEFVRAEDIYSDIVESGNFKSLLSNASTSEYFNKEGIDLVSTRLLYEDPESAGNYYIVAFEYGVENNELLMHKYLNNTKSVNISGAIDKGTIPLGDHLSAPIPPQITFYRRLSLNRRVVALVKVKINYQHDGITKQYDLFYHLRNLTYSTN